MSREIETVNRGPGPFRDTENLREASLITEIAGDMSSMGDCRIGSRRLSSIFTLTTTFEKLRGSSATVTKYSSSNPFTVQYSIDGVNLGEVGQDWGSKVLEGARTIGPARGEIRVTNPKIGQNHTENQVFRRVGPGRVGVSDRSGPPRCRTSPKSVEGRPSRGAC